MSGLPAKSMPEATEDKNFSKTTEDSDFNESSLYYRLRSLDQDDRRRVQVFIAEQEETQEDVMGALGLLYNHDIPRDQLPKLQLKEGDHRLKLGITTDLNAEKPIPLLRLPDKDPRVVHPDMETYGIPENLDGYKKSIVSVFHIFLFPLAEITLVRPIPVGGQSGYYGDRIVLTPEISFHAGQKELILIGTISLVEDSDIQAHLRFGLDVFEDPSKPSHGCV